MYPSTPKKSKETEKEREKLQNYQEETFYILQKLKQLQASQVSLEKIKTDHFSKYLENLFRIRTNTLTMFPEGDLQSINLFYKRKAPKKKTGKSYQDISKINLRNEWVEEFLTQLKDDSWRFDNKLFENMQKELSEQWREMKEAQKEMKEKKEYQEELLLLKSQVSELSEELERKQKEHQKEKQIQQQRIEELEETNKRLLNEIHILKQSVQETEYKQ
jgi:hypothetical protein